MKVYWTQFAENKLEDIYAYYEFKAGPIVAKNIINGIIDATLILDSNPYSGPKEELLKDRIQDFHYLVFENYKIIYSINEVNMSVFISHVFDTRQNPKKLIHFK